MPAELVFVNGAVFTADGTRIVAEGIAVAHGRITHIGSTAEVRAEVGPGTRVIDVGGRGVLPGFVDCHAHPILLGRSSSQIDTTPESAPTLDDIQNAFRHAASRDDGGQWLVGRGYDHTRLDGGRHPTKHDLDLATGTRPALLVHRCGHVGVANSAALRLAGIGADTADPTGGSIDRDARGEPVGLLREAALECIRRLVPAPSRSELKRAILAAGRHLLSYGITSVTDAHVSSSDELAAYEELARAEELPLRVNLMMGYDETFEELRGLGVRSGVGNEWLRFGPIKLFQDGSGSGATAATSQAYPGDGSNYGIVMHTQDELSQRVCRASAAGFDVATHAVGDHAIEMVLDAYEEALTRGSRPDACFRIEHCGLCTPEILDRLQRLGIAVCFQPGFIHFLGDAYLGNFNPEQLALAYPARSWLDRGIPVAASSDAPVIPCDPFTGLRAAVTRLTQDGRQIAAAEQVSLEDAVRMYTWNTAHVSRDDRLKGSIEVGKFADLVVTSRDPLRVLPTELHTLRADMTILDGRVVFERPGRKSIALDPP